MATSLAGIKAAGMPGTLSSLKRQVRAGLRSLVECGVLGDSLYWRLPPRQQGVALTFDDGPDPEHTPGILDLLAEHGARATFFVVGFRAQRHPELVRRMLAEGHAVGNHTHTHVRCPELDPAAFRRELREAQAALAGIAPPPDRPLFRPPFGSLTPRQAWLLVRGGWRVALWSRDSYDYRGAAAGEIAALGESLAPRDILLMHDRFPATAAALPGMIARLKERGVPLVTLEDTEVTAPVGWEPARVVKVLAGSWRSLRSDEWGGRL